MSQPSASPSTARRASSPRAPHLRAVPRRARRSPASASRSSATARSCRAAASPRRAWPTATASRSSIAVGGRLTMAADAKLVVARQGVRLAPAGRHRQVPGLRRDAPRHRGERRRDRHGRDPPHQHRPERGRAQPARRAAAVALHDPAQHRRLLHRGGRGAHAAPRARAARRPRAGEARGAGRRRRRSTPTCPRRSPRRRRWSPRASR